MVIIHQDQPIHGYNKQPQRHIIWKDFSMSSPIIILWKSMLQHVVMHESKQIINICLYHLFVMLKSYLNNLLQGHIMKEMSSLSPNSVNNNNFPPGPLHLTLSTRATGRNLCHSTVWYVPIKTKPSLSSLWDYLLFIKPPQPGRFKANRTCVIKTGAS